MLGGLAVGAVGVAILGNALAQPRQAPVYLAPPPPAPRVVYVQPAGDPFESRMSLLHDACDDGDRHACIKFGIIIGQHQERVADWRHIHPDYFTY